MSERNEQLEENNVTWDVTWDYQSNQKLNKYSSYKLTSSFSYNTLGLKSSFKKTHVTTCTKTKLPFLHSFVNYSLKPNN